LGIAREKSIITCIEDYIACILVEVFCLSVARLNSYSALASLKVMFCTLFLWLGQFWVYKGKRYQESTVINELGKKAEMVSLHPVLLCRRLIYFVNNKK